MNDTVALSEEQRREFRERGVLCVRQLIGDERYGPARDAVFQGLAQKGVWSNGAWDYAEHQNGDATAGAKLVRGSRRSPAFDLLPEGEIETAVAELLDHRPHVPLGERPQTLFTLPNAKEWSLPSTVWHLDMPRLPEAGEAAPGVQIFTFLDTVEPKGGGTLLLSGSHRFLNDDERIASKDVKLRLKERPYFRDLFSASESSNEERERRFLSTEIVDGIDVLVVEVHGEPGDVFFMDLRVFHTLSPNTSSRPRVMMTHRWVLDSLHAAVFAPNE